MIEHEFGDIQQMRQVDVAVAYGLWCLSLFGLCGIQRLYTGKTISGLLYLLTFGFCFIGQFIDLFLIPGLVQERNTYLQGLYGSPNHPFTLINPTAELAALQEEVTASQTPMQKLLRAAQENGGTLSAAQAALLTKLEPDELREVLVAAQRAGYAQIYNDPVSGAIRYQFDL